MEKDKELSLTVEKEFKVPVEELFEALTDPEALKQWWTPLGNKLQKIENEVTPGGTFRYEAGKDNEQTSLVITGSYESVIENEQLVYSWNFYFPDSPVEESLYKLSVFFSESGVGSMLHVEQENLQHEGALVVHREGWEKGLEDLRRYLESK